MIVFLKYLLDGLTRHVALFFVYPKCALESAKGGPGRIRTCDQAYSGSNPVRLQFYLMQKTGCGPSGSASTGQQALMAFIPLTASYGMAVAPMLLSGLGSSLLGTVMVHWMVG
jgi:hypothetical protein